MTVFRSRSRTRLFKPTGTRTEQYPLLALGLIWGLSTLNDVLWCRLDRSVPSWDPAKHLISSLDYWAALQHPNFFSGEWWTSFWMLSPKYPPLIYIVTAPLLAIFGRGMDQATLVNVVFTAVLIGAVYGLGRRLYNAEVGVWAAGLCILLPRLYDTRTLYLIDYPLMALVALSFYCLTVWRDTKMQRDQWLWILGFGVSFGLAMLTKQTALLFLLVPLLWVAGGALWQRQWERLAQLAASLGIAAIVFMPWYRTNWIFIASASQNANTGPALYEGDPPLNTIGAWIYYWKDLPNAVSWPLLLVAIVGLLLYWSQLFTSFREKPDLRLSRSRRLAKSQNHNATLRWFLLFCGSSYLILSAVVNKDQRYIMPYLPVVAVVLSYGLTRWRNQWRWWVRWGTVGLMTGLMLLTSYPIGGTLGTSITRLLAPNVGRQAYVGPDFPHTQVISEILKTEPYLRSNLAVLPSTPEIDQHNFDYYGALRNFQVYARQVGTQMKFVSQDLRSFSWFLTKTESQGTYASQMQAPQAAFVQAVEQSPDLRVQKSWKLPDGSTLNLYHRRSSPVEVTPLSSPSPRPSTGKVKLDRVILPAQVPPGAPVPVTYEWSGPWNQLQSGIVLLTWWTDFSTPSRLGVDSAPGTALPPARSPRQPTPPSSASTVATNNYWIHDHGLGLGRLHSGQSGQLQLDQPREFRVIERTAMLPPNGTPAASYRLSARYLNRETGESYAISVPSTVRVAIEPAAKPAPAPELDWVTQLRTLAITLPQGRSALDPIFDKVGQINLYDPVQDYLVQAQKALEYRLQKEPQNLGFAYGIALSQVLQRHVSGAIVALQRVSQLDAKNPYAHAYLAFVNLADLRPGAAQKALKPALVSHPNVPELKALNAIAALMRGNLVQAWQESRGLRLDP